ncbi:unnamed protein product [Parnassius apollo]|uniref:(apollo) hypothetical protein n=1 Tax=Parnassius apollo TaxID=110799 RepID=A0A8S3X5R6_PARAO|nr:unnamed protein product [Parnassius apollo]
MTQFIELKSPSFNLSEKQNVTPNSQSKLCVCCLSGDVLLIKLDSCKHAGFLFTLFENKVDLTSAFVCYLCHNIIRKIDSFKCQVEESCAVLRGNVNQPKTWKYKLKNSKTEINSTINCQPIEFEYKENFVSSDTVLEHVITEIKVEHDSDFDCDADLPLAQIKEVKELRNTNENRNKKQKVKVKKRSLIHEKYEGKIKTITISWEEMMEERKRDALRKSYLNLPFKCENCIVGFDHEKTLKVHIEQRHSDKKGAFVCDVCKSVLSTETSYKEHRKRHLRRYECEVCGKRNNNVYSVVKHYKEEHGTINTLFTCKDCGFTTESHRGYRYHRDKHKGKVECTECGNTFVHATGLRVHMFTVHGQSDRVYSCEECGKRYRSKSSLATHRSVHNTSASPETFCALCNTQFRSPLGLKHHLKTHSKHIRDSDKSLDLIKCLKITNMATIAAKD